MGVTTNKKYRFSSTLLLPVLLPILLVGGLVLLHHGPQPSRIAALGLLEAKLPEDNTYAELSPILKKTQSHQTLNLYRVPFSEEARRCSRALNQEAVDTFMVWYEDRGYWMLEPREDQGVHIRVEPGSLNLDIDNQELMKSSWFRRLQMALLAEYDLCRKEGRDLAAANILEASMKLHRYWLTNPHLFMTASALRTLNLWAAYLSQQERFDGLSLFDQLPSQELIHQAVRQDIWFDSLIFQQRMTKKALIASGEKSAALTPPLFLESNCLKWIDDSFFFYQAQLDEPLQNFEVFPIDVDKSPVNWVGRDILAQNQYGSGTVLAHRYGITLVYLDLLRIHVFLLDAGRTWNQEQAQDAVNSLALMNPFDGKPYQFDENGLLRLFPLEDSRWVELDLMDIPIRGLYVH